MYQINKAVGIDVSKDTLDLCLKYSDKLPQKFAFDNSSAGVIKLINWCKKMIESNTPIIIESTGDYHLLAVFRLAERGFQVHLINPLLSAAYGKLHVRKLKSDTVDASRLADLAWHPEINLPAPFALSNQDVSVKKTLNLIHTFENKICALKMCLKRYTKTHQDLDSDIPELIQPIKETIKQLDKQISRLKRSLEKQVDTTSVDKLSIIPGVSKTNASLIIGHLNGCIFTNQKQLVGYTGLDVAVKESGYYKGKVRVSKRGNGHLRKVLGQIAWGLIMHHDRFAKLNQRLIEQGRHYFERLVILARKFLQLAFVILYKNQSYDPSKLRFAC